MASNPYILVVEDDASTRSATQQFLERAGYHVACASDGQQASEYLREHPPPALILLDLDLPVVSGREFRESQRQQPGLAHIPVVAISGEDDLAQEAEHLCLDGFLHKPFDGSALLDLVRSCGACSTRFAPLSRDGPFT